MTRIKYEPQHAFMQPITQSPNWCSVDLSENFNLGIIDKLILFRRLVNIGFKEIEIAWIDEQCQTIEENDTNIAFIRQLICEHHIPADVKIQIRCSPYFSSRVVLNALQGLQEVSLHFSSSQLTQFTKKIKQWLEADIQNSSLNATHIVYSYEPINWKNFNQILADIHAVVTVVQPSKNRRLKINLAPRIDRELPHINAILLSFLIENIRHPDIEFGIYMHNDRGTSVSAAELCIATGIRHVTGSILGIGLRAGATNLATLAINLHRINIPTGLNLRDLDAFYRNIGSLLNITLHSQYPYMGELVLTVSNTQYFHRIEQSLSAHKKDPLAVWDVPYVPIHPYDIGREHEDFYQNNTSIGLLKLNHILKTYGFDLPCGFVKEINLCLAKSTKNAGDRWSEHDIINIFQKEFIFQSKVPFELISLFLNKQDTQHVINGSLVFKQNSIEIHAEHPNNHWVALLKFFKERFNIELFLYDYGVMTTKEHQFLSYCCLRDIRGDLFWAVAVEIDNVIAVAKVLVIAINRAVQSAIKDYPQLLLSENASSEYFIAEDAGIEMHSMSDRRQLRYSPPTCFSYDLSKEFLWPTRTLVSAPQWCNVDISTSKVHMKLENKLQLFRLLVELGFKEIETASFEQGYHAENLEFLELLVREHHIPEDVFIQITVTPDKSSMDYLLHIMSPISKIIIQVKHINHDSIQKCDDFLRTLKTLQVNTLLVNTIRIEYSISIEEMHLSENLHKIKAMIQVHQTQEIILNLVSTPFNISLGHYGNQIEYLTQLFLDYPNVTISVQVSNEGDHAVAAAEIAQLAGAHRIKGTLFGHGEPLGSSDLIILALNLHTLGMDHGLALQSLDKVRKKFEKYTGLLVGSHHSYVGDRVTRAFTNTPEEIFHTLPVLDTWSVPRFSVNYSDFGYSLGPQKLSLGTVSQEDVADLMFSAHGYKIPDALSQEFLKTLKQKHDSNFILEDESIWNDFCAEYLKPKSFFTLTHIFFQRIVTEPQFKLACTGKLLFIDKEVAINSIGSSAVHALYNFIRETFHLSFKFMSSKIRILENGADKHIVVSYACLEDNVGDQYWGVGIDYCIELALIRALLSGINRTILLSPTLQSYLEEPGIRSTEDEIQPVVAPAYLNKYSFFNMLNYRMPSAHLQAITPKSHG